MKKGTKILMFAGLSLAALVGMDLGAGWAGLPNYGARYAGDGVLARGSDPATVILARGKRGGNSGGGYGAQDGSGSAPRPQDGTGYGAKQGTGSGNCDGTGPKGKGRGKRTN